MCRVLYASACPVVSVWKSSLAVRRMLKVCVLHIVYALFTMQYWHAALQFMQSRCWRFLSERDKHFLDICGHYVKCIYVAKSGCRLLCGNCACSNLGCGKEVQTQCGANAGQTSLPTAKPCGRNAKLMRQKFGRGACSFSKRNMSTSCKQQVCGHVCVCVCEVVCLLSMWEQDSMHI